MNASYEKEYYLRAADFDWRSRLSPAAILDLFQDVAGAHAEELGCGSMSERCNELVWVLVKVKLQILGSVGMYSKVKVKTWPLQPATIRFQREYLIENEDGAPLVKGSSEWVLMHYLTRKAMPVKNAYPSNLEHLTEHMFEGRFTRVKDFEPEGEAYVMTPRLSDIDLNGHVNNTKYANFVLDALLLPQDELIDTMQIDYHREVKRETQLSIYTRRSGGEILAKGTGDDGELMFSCRIQLKEKGNEETE